MVRLKDLVKEDQEERGVFQFLMVRLKGTKTYSGLDLKIGFQFLMVRLKVSSQSVKIVTLLISIPYGSIKRTSPLMT